MLRRALSFEGCAVATARDGGEALKKTHTLRNAGYVLREPAARSLRRMGTDSLLTHDVSVMRPTEGPSSVRNILGSFWRASR